MKTFKIWLIVLVLSCGLVNSAQASQCAMEPPSKFLPQMKLVDPSKKYAGFAIGQGANM